MRVYRPEEQDQFVAESGEFGTEALAGFGDLDSFMAAVLADDE